jgi:acetyl-CoA acyltransferase
MEAIHIAAGKISMGSGKVFICAGVESMTRVKTGFDSLPYPFTEDQNNNPHLYLSMGITAENVAKKYNISRQEQQEFAIKSHEKAYMAQKNGKFNNEIIKIDNCKIDENIRPNSTMEKLNSLKLAFDQNGTVTAATSSPLTDGAAATLICEENFAKENNLEIFGRIVSTAVEGCDPNFMGLGPISATKKALERAKLTINEIDIVELNEAFASQSLACIKDLEIDPNKVNLDGGALALGHPLGATGARITGKAASLLKRENKNYALATQCIGLGMGIATIIKNI